MKVGLVTNWNQNCGVAEYAKNLAYYGTKAGVEYKIITGVLNFEGVWAQAEDVDVIHFNYCRHAYRDMDSFKFTQFRGHGKPVILTFHESTAWSSRIMALNGVADWLVIHDRLRDGPPQPFNVKTIPHGIPDIDVSGIKVDKEVGTFGCAFPWKGLYPLAWTCGKLDVSLTAQLSEADPDKGGIYWPDLRKLLASSCPKLELIEGWRSQEEIVKELARCQVIAMPFDPQAQIEGISSSVRLALAARRPLVLTRSAHFGDLYDYDFEIYFADGNMPAVLKKALFEATSEIVPAKIPKVVVEDMGWERSAQFYCKLYEESLKTQVMFVKND